jgi:cysteinyl-tRNA synthetase
MTLRLHDTLTRKVEDFAPLEPGVVRLYTCGPTVYDYSHVGNLRTYLFFDLLRRHLRWSGYRVDHVINITDVDDKIIRRAAAAGVTIGEYTPRWEEAFHRQLKQLRAQPAERYPRATEHIPEMIELIQRLLERGHAYQAEDGVYYRIDSFPTYGELAHLDREGLRRGTRVAADEYDKDSANDFALWKRADPIDERVRAAWDAPFGRGRPGWHIECSAMSMRYLGETLDIHSGAIDLLFPHHQNEVAQSEGATGRQFSRYWVHPEHITAGKGEKMAKSLGNMLVLDDLLGSGFDAATVRMFLMTTAHYRSRLQVTDDGLHGAREQVRRLRDLSDRLHRQDLAEEDDSRLVDLARQARRRYRGALDDDLNLPQAVGYLFDLVREANAALDAGGVGPGGRRELLGALSDADAHLDVLRVEEEASLDREVERLIAEREEARGRRDFGTSDRIRENLRERGIALEDTAQGVRWRHFQ